MTKSARTAAAVMTVMLTASSAHAWIPVGGGDKPKLEIETRFMLLGVWFGRDLVAPGTVEQTEDVEDFFLRRGRLLARYRPTDKLELYLQIGQDNWGTKVVADETGLRIKDFYVNWKAKDSIQIVGGQFKIPFLRNNLQSGFNQLLVDRSAVVLVRPAREGSRDIGFMAWGNAAGFQYRAALTDGSDQEDLNSGSSPRGSARVSWNWGTHETTLGYTGTSIGKEKVFQIGLQGDYQGDRADTLDLGFTSDRRDYGAWAVDAYFDHPFGHDWAVTTEGAWIQRHDNYEDPALGIRDITAFYVQAGLLLPCQFKGTRFQIAARLDDLDSQRNTGRSSTTGKTLGLSWFLRGHDQKIQLDYTRRTERPTNLDNDALRLSVVMVF